MELKTGNTEVLIFSRVNPKLQKLLIYANGTLINLKTKFSNFLTYTILFLQNEIYVHLNTCKFDINTNNENTVVICKRKIECNQEIAE